MTIKYTMLDGGIKRIQQAGDFILGGVYQLTNGFYAGRLIHLTYISPYKQIVIDGVRHRQISGVLQGETTKINSIVAHLQAHQC